MAFTLFFAKAASAQEAPAAGKSPDETKPQPATLPAALTLPWRTPGIDPAELGPARTALTKSWEALAASWLQNQQTLTALATVRKPVPINYTKVANRIAVGEPKTGAANTPLVVEPVWCSVMDRHVLLVTVSDARRNVLLGSAHTTVPRGDWKRLERSKALEPMLTGRLTKLAQDALSQASTRAAQPPTDAFHLALDLGLNATRRDEGSSLCLTALIEEQLAPKYTVARAVGADELATVRELLGLPAELRRPTRRVVMRWLATTAARGPKDKKTPPVDRTLPVTLKLVATFAESVFGKHLPIAHESEWTIAPGPGDTLAVTVDPALGKILEDERRPLALADWPQVAKVDRGWVYLDRGRAWGLKMSDRLIATVDGTPVRAHVVRFFGPEENLTSPRGFPIREGAILFVRKGQNLTKLGLEFRMDPKTFPSP